MGGTADTLSYDDGSGIVDLLSGLSGSEPAVTDIEDPWGNGTVVGSSYEWEGIVVSVYNGRAGVAISVPEVGDTKVQTPEGISVGSTRAEAMAAGAWTVWDQDGNGNANYLGIGSREVPDTRSLSNPGSVGIEYLMLVLADDAVGAIHVPANDFSDI